MGIAAAHNGIRTEFTLDVASSLTQVLAETTNGQTISYLYGLGLVGEMSAGQTEYHLTDGLGSVRQITNTSGSVLLAQTFDPYGNRYEQSRGSVLWDAASPFGWTGEQSDPNGLTYLRARYYAPSMGRFTQIDPFAGALALPASMNGYGYAHNSPVMYTDPSGQFPWLILLIPVAIGLGVFAWDYTSQAEYNMQERGMDFWTAMDPANVDEQRSATYGLIAAGISAPVVIGCALAPEACAPLLLRGFALLQAGDAVDDLMTYWLALNGDQEAAAQLMIINWASPADGPNSLLAISDDVVEGVGSLRRFARRNADDVGEAVKYADDVGGAAGATRRALIVGESDEVVGESEAFEYARNLARAHSDWEVIGTRYGNGSNTQDLLDPPADIPNLTLYDNVDARRLREGAIGAQGRIIDDIVFHGPERDAMEINGRWRTWRESSGDLVEEVINGAPGVLRPGGSVRFTSGGAMPANYRLYDLVKQPNWPDGYIGSKVPWNQGGDFVVPFTSRRTNGQRLPHFANQQGLFWYIFTLSQ